MGKFFTIDFARGNVAWMSATKGVCIIRAWNYSEIIFEEDIEMKNEYIKNLNKIEFVVTYACTGKCKHCSEGEHTNCGERIDPQISADAVRRISAEYDVKTVMTFGGEPLLYPDTVYAVMSAASELNIERRQVITNGYFSKDIDKIRDTVEKLSACGVNDLRLSVDAFHQETIPLGTVRQFAAEAKRAGIPMRLQPAWLVSRDDDNLYNRKTREILDSFADMDIPESDGNVIFPEGNAKRYLAEYFKDGQPENPYVDDPCDVRCLSFEPNGNVLGGNVYKQDIMEIIDNYNPKKVIKCKEL